MTENTSPISNRALPWGGLLGLLGLALVFLMREALSGVFFCLELSTKHREARLVFETLNETALYGILGAAILLLDASINGVAVLRWRGLAALTRLGRVVLVTGGGLVILGAVFLAEAGRTPIAFAEGVWRDGHLGDLKVPDVLDHLNGALTLAFALLILGQILTWIGLSTAARTENPEARRTGKRALLLAAAATGLFALLLGISFAATRPLYTLCHNGLSGIEARPSEFFAALKSARAWQLGAALCLAIRGLCLILAAIKSPDIDDEEGSSSYAASHQRLERGLARLFPAFLILVGALALYRSLGPPQVQRLIRDLAVDREDEDHHRAQERLIDLGPAAAPELLASLPVPPLDLEFHDRVYEILAAIHRQRPLTRELRREIAREGRRVPVYLGLIQGLHPELRAEGLRPLKTALEQEKDSLSCVSRSLEEIRNSFDWTRRLPPFLAKLRDLDLIRAVMALVREVEPATPELRLELLIDLEQAAQEISSRQPRQEDFKAW